MPGAEDRSRWRLGVEEIIQEETEEKHFFISTVKRLHFSFLPHASFGKFYIRSRVQRGSISNLAQMQYGVNGILWEATTRHNIVVHL